MSRLVVAYSFSELPGRADVPTQNAEYPYLGFSGTSPNLSPGSAAIAYLVAAGLSSKHGKLHCYAFIS